MTLPGMYEYLGSFRPLNNQSRDLTLFKDTDGKAYLIHEDRAAGVRILQLSSDYLTIDREIALIQAPMESPAILKKNGTYFLIGSHLTGWNPNPNKYTKAPSLAGPWVPYEDIAPPSTNTYASQTAYILTVAGRLTTTYIYVGDRWFANNLGDSRYIWLPLRIDATSLSLTWCDAWAIDTLTGLFSVSCNPYPNGFNFYLPMLFYILF